MASTLPDGAGRTHLNDVRAGRANLRIDANSGGNAPEKRRKFAALVREAMRRADLSQKAFAITAAVPESAVSEALHGSRHLPSEWLWDQDDRFWTELRDLVDQERRLTDHAKRAESVDDILELLRRILMRGTRREDVA